MLNYSQFGVTKWDFHGGALRKLLAAVKFTQAEVVSRSSSFEILCGWMSFANSPELYFLAQVHTCRIQQMIACQPNTRQ
jgi:hypothetical protein